MCSCCINALCGGFMNAIYIAIYMFIGSTRADTPIIFDEKLLEIEVEERIPAKRKIRMHVCPPPLLKVRESFIEDIGASIRAL